MPEKRATADGGGGGSGAACSSPLTKVKLSHLLYASQSVQTELSEVSSSTNYTGGLPKKQIVSSGPVFQSLEETFR